MATYDKLTNKANGHKIQVQSAIEDGVGCVIKDTYSKQNGYYPSLTAGLSENLTSKMTLCDKTPYLVRTAGGSLEVGNKCYVKNVIGGTVVFNQLIKNGNFESTSGWSLNGITLVVNNNVAEITPNSSSLYGFSIYRFQENYSYASHKYLLALDLKTNAIIAPKKAGYGFGGTYKTNCWDITSDWQTFSAIFNATNDGLTGIGIYGNNAGNVPDGKIYVKNCRLFDLTKLFGGSIANYIYSLEQGQVGAGLAFLKKFFPKNHYGYNAGELLSVKTAGKKIVGFNAYNHLTRTAKLLGGYEYQASGTYTSLAYQDINGNTGTFSPDANGKFTPEYNCTVLVTGGSTDTCIHLVWDGERDGEYESYSETTYTLANTELRGIPKLDRDNNLYYDGDAYSADGIITRKYGILLLSQDYAVYQTITIPNMKSNTSNVICDGYGFLGEWGEIMLGATTTIINNKPLHSGDIIVYELETPTTETATPFTELQQVDNWGTEEYSDDRTVQIPVGHNTDYLPDLKAKLEVVPESPTMDGYYVMKRDSGENSYSLLNSWLSANYYVKKEEIALTNVGTITATEIVSGSLYRNDIAVSGGVDAEDIIFIEMSDSVVYPTLNTNGTTLTVFCATNLSSISVSKMWKL